MGEEGREGGKAVYTFSRDIINLTSNKCAHACDFRHEIWQLSVHVNMV